MSRKQFYFDYAATTPVDPRVVKRMTPYFNTHFGNPGSIHAYGQKAIAAIDQARGEVARAIGAQFGEVIFTSGATEANNLALRGAIKGFRVQGAGQRDDRKSLTPHPSPLRPRVIVSAVEHESVLETARDLEKEGVEVVIIPVSREGIVDLAKLKEALDERTVLVSVVYANHEVGVIQSIKEIGKSIEEFHQRISNSKRIYEFENSKKIRYSMMKPLFHTDAVQAFQYLDCDVERLGVDLMTLSSHKVYGPKGAGALYVRQREVRSKKYEVRKNDGAQKLLSLTSYLLPLTAGGGQEYGLRSGTENVPAIVGFGAAAKLVTQMRVKESRRVALLRDYLINKIEKVFPDWTVNGSRTERLPHNAHVRMPGIAANDMLMALDQKGFAVSAGSACAARTSTPSRVVQAMGFSREYAGECIRITLGRPTALKDIDDLLRTLVVLRKKLTND